MKFIEPKNKRAKKVSWKISEQTRAIVKYYSEYAERSEDEIVDEFLENILLDEKFMKWIEERRYNKRIINQIFDMKNTEERSIG